jgi:cytochrome c556
MRMWMLAGLVAALGGVGAAWAQGNVVADRRAGLRNVGSIMEAFNNTVRDRGDVRALAPRVDEIAAFFGDGFVARFPANSGTPPLPQGTGEGQTRALPAIWSDPAGFEQARRGLLATLPGFKAAAAAGDVAATQAAMREVGGACAACHRNNRAR